MTWSASVQSQADKCQVPDIVTRLPSRCGAPLRNPFPARGDSPMLFSPLANTAQNAESR
jgi:hypothetical protein